MIKSSLDWNDRRTTLSKQIHDLPYNPDLRKLLGNIDEMIRTLSKLEVESRRTHNDTKSSGQLEKINSAIDHLEHWIMMAALLK